MAGLQPVRRLSARRSRPAARLLWIAAGLAAGALVGERLWLAATQPLWLDETWTAAIVSAPGAQGFWREVWLDVNAPLYYVLMRGWTSLFGLSDLALRAPGLILAPLAGALALWSPNADPPAPTRRAWAALLVFWWGCGQFLDARCYALLLVLCALQALAFIRLLQSPSLVRALVWTTVSALAILTQYYALFIGLAQGLVYLWVCRGRAARAWPALIALTPVCAWIAWHGPRLAQYGRPDVAWHPALDAVGALALAGFSIAGYSPGLALCVVLILAIAALWPHPGGAGRPVEAPAPAGAAPWAAAAAGLLALVLILGGGLLKPTLTARYLIPVVPSMLLGVALCAQASRRPRAALIALGVVYAAFALDPLSLPAKLRQGAPYGTESASGVLAAQGVTDVVFLWDHPAAKIMDPGSLTRVGGAAFHRAGAAVAVTPIIVAQGEDANLRLLGAAHGRRPGLIWIYDRTGRTSAAAHPPRISALDPRWTCVRFGDAMIGSLACYQAGSPRSG